MRYVVSALHHSIPPLRPGSIAEEDDIGWHFRTAKALMRYGGFRAIAARPSGSETTLVKLIDGTPVVLTPTIILSPSGKLWKWSEYSPALAQLTEYLVKKFDAIPYIHEYRALNSELIMRRLIGYPMILQHHGSQPPTLRNTLKPNIINDIKELSKLRREALLRRVKGAIFVVNKAEKRYLEDILDVDAHVMIRTMAVDFDELKPPTCEEKAMLRRANNILEDSIVLITYAGVFREELSTLKGAHLIPKLWKDLKKEYGSKITLIVTGLTDYIAEKYRELGILAHKFLPHKEFLNLLKLSDVFFMLATKEYYGAGGAVTMMEALALGKPIVSPALIEYPETEKIRHLGRLAPYIITNDEKTYQQFLNSLLEALSNLNYFKENTIRELAFKYYSWQSFVKDFKEALRKINQ